MCSFCRQLLRDSLNRIERVRPVLLGSLSELPHEPHSVAVCSQRRSQPSIFTQIELCPELGKNLLISLEFIRKKKVPNIRPSLSLFANSTNNLDGAQKITETESFRKD